MHKNGNEIYLKKTKEKKSGILSLLRLVFFVVLQLEIDDQYHDYVIATTFSLVLIVVVA